MLQNIAWNKDSDWALGLKQAFAALASAPATQPTKQKASNVQMRRSSNPFPYQYLCYIKGSASLFTFILFFQLFHTQIMLVS